MGVVAAVSCLGAAAARAQSTTNEWWNQLDLYWTAPSDQWRVYGLAQEARGIETSDRQLTLGLHLDDRSGRSTLPTAGLPHTTHTSGGEAPI